MLPNLFITALNIIENSFNFMLHVMHYSSATGFWRCPNCMLYETESEEIPFFIILWL